MALRRHPRIQGRKYHEGVVEKFSVADGVRDLGLLESALYRPQSGYCEEFSDTVAALESLLMNDPSVDGNAHIAFFASDVFLRLNGWRLDVDADEAHPLFIGLLETEKRISRACQSGSETG